MAASGSLINRMVRAAKLDSGLYEEVEADTKANGQALLAVVLASLATGIGTGIAGLFMEEGGLWFVWGLLLGLFSSIIGWLIWSFLTYIIGTKVFKTSQTSANWGELLRAIGFANSPGVLRIFSFIPFIGGLVSFGVSIWSLIAGIIAVRHWTSLPGGPSLPALLDGLSIWLPYSYSHSCYWVPGRLSRTPLKR